MGKFDNFRQARRAKRLNRIVQILLALSLTVLLNFIASRHFWREDITENNRYSLSPETLAYIQQLREPVRIILASDPEQGAQSGEEAEARKRIFNDVSGLLREYEYAGWSGNDSNIQIEYVDIFRNSTKTEELVREYGLRPDDNNAIVVVSGERYRELDPMNDLYIVRNDQPVFVGESALTSAILDVTRPEQSKIYFTGGHGEMAPDSVSPQRGLSALHAFLKRRSYATELLDLTQVKAVPEDASLVIIAGPQTAFLPIEQEKLRQYMNLHNGRLLILTDPGRRHGLDDLFYDWGVLSDDMLVVEPAEDSLASQGNLLVGNYGRSPVTDYLRTNQLRLLFGPTRPVREDPGAPRDERRHLQEIVASSQQSWAERNYRQQPYRYDKLSDLPAPVSLGLTVERVENNDLGINLAGGRMAVFGNSSWASNQMFGHSNSILFFNTLNWLLNQQSLMNIPPRITEMQQLVISQQGLRNVVLWLLAVPVAAAIAGLFVGMARRR